MLDELLKMEIETINMNDVEFLDEIAEELATSCGIACYGGTL